METSQTSGALVPQGYFNKFLPEKLHTRQGSSYTSIPTSFKSTGDTIHIITIQLVLSGSPHPSRMLE